MEINEINRIKVSSNLNITTGRFVKESDKERAVCAIADQMAEELFGYSDSIGKTLSATFNGKVIISTCIGFYSLEDG